MAVFIGPITRAVRLAVLRRRIRRLLHIYDSVVLFKPEAFYPLGPGVSAIAKWKWVPSPIRNPRISVLRGEVELTWEEVETMVRDARSMHRSKQRSGKSTRVPIHPRAV